MNFKNIAEICENRHKIASQLKETGKFTGTRWTDENYTAPAVLNGIPVRLSVCFSYGNRTGMQPGYIQVGYPDGRTWLNTQSGSIRFYVR